MSYPYGYPPPQQIPNGRSYIPPSSSWGYPQAAHPLQQPAPLSTAPAYHGQHPTSNHPMVVIPQRSNQINPQQYQPHPPQSHPQYAHVRGSQPTQAHQHSRQNPQVVIPQQYPHTLVATSVPTAVKPGSPLPVDYHLLLLGLAEEYIAAAHGMGSLAAIAQRQEEQDQYYKLMATGLSCMEAVLLKWRLYPRLEAALRLRYATLLYDETNNNRQAETVLSKGIALCQRNRLLDLKYSMQHLLTRILYKTSPKAALKSLDTVISEVEAYQYVPWVYAFRFLRASLSLQLRSPVEISSALQNLHSISALADRQGDRAVFVTSATLEAMVHLRSTATDHVEQAQRAIATARSLQLQTSMTELGQVIALLDFLDLACSLQQYTPDQAFSKMQAMQAVMDEAIRDGDETGIFTVMIDQTIGSSLTTATGGIFQKRKDGRDELTFSWLPKRDLYTIGYFLSGITAYLKSPIDSKTEKYLLEGIKILDAVSIPETPQDSLHGAAARAEWRLLIDWNMRLYLVFVSCTKAEWDSARKSLALLKETGHRISLEPAEKVTQIIEYLAGVIDQGSGFLDSALQHFQAPELSLPPTVNRSLNAQHDICILAALNSLLIIHSLSHPQHFRVNEMVTRVEPLCLSHPNKALVAAFYLTKASANNMESIVKTKQCIQLSLQAAKATANQQLLSMSMNLMTASFFTDIVGEQAEKSARAGRQLAKRCKDDLWVVVADGMLMSTLERHGKPEEARMARDEMLQLIGKLPPPLRNGL